MPQSHSGCKCREGEGTRGQRRGLALPLGAASRQHWAPSGWSGQGELRQRGEGRGGWAGRQALHAGLGSVFLFATQTG